MPIAISEFIPVNAGDIGTAQRIARRRSSQHV
jgi:hypothetical protein